MQKSYYRIMPGRQSGHKDECLTNSFIGADFGIAEDLTGKLPEEWRQFNKEYIPVYLKNKPDKSKIAAGLACGALHTICKGISKGDIIFSPDGEGSYLVGEVVGDYSYVPGKVLPHRRKIDWYSDKVNRSEMSQALQNSTGYTGTVTRISKYADEIENLISGSQPIKIISNDESIEDPSAFALEKHLEEFLVKNWQQTELGKDYNIFEEDGELVGQQYPSDTGPIDILAVSKDNSEILVVELKKGRASDNVVGQIQRYMGYVLEELAEPNQKVSGVIIAFEDDLKIRRALAVAQNITFYTYQLKFSLHKL